MLTQACCEHMHANQLVQMAVFICVCQYVQVNMHAHTKKDIHNAACAEREWPYISTLSHKQDIEIYMQVQDMQAQLTRLEMV